MPDALADLVSAWRHVGFLEGVAWSFGGVMGWMVVVGAWAGKKRRDEIDGP